MSLNRKQAAVVVLFVLIPTGLFFSFWLPSVLNGSSVVVSETVEADLVRWSLERPGAEIDLSGMVISSFLDGEVSSVFDIWIFKYGKNVFEMWINGSAHVSEGFVKSAYMVLKEDHALSVIDFWRDPSFIKFENLSFVGFADYSSDALKQPEKGHMTFEGLSNPDGVSFEAYARWGLNSPENQTHSMNATLELIYNNGTVYKKLVHPVQLETYPDSNDIPDTAEEIQNGTQIGKCIGGYDHRDFYRIYLASGQNLRVQLRHASVPAPVYTLHVYEPTMNERAYNDTIDSDKTVTIAVDQTGFWLIEVRSVSPDLYCGFYEMDVSS